MNITQENVNDNHLKLVVNVQPEDYAGKVEDEIRSLSKKITMNGFRPGKVPVGLAKKFYGDTVLADQLDKLLNESITGYIKEHNFRVLGQPIPFEVKHQHIDVQKKEAYDFGFELGLIPDFELPDFATKNFEQKIIKITDEMISAEKDRITGSYGERSNPEAAADGDILAGEWKELNEEGEIKENGIQTTSSFSLSIVKDDVSKQLLMNLKKGESTDINIRTAFGNDTELIIHNILKTDHAAAEQMNDRFRFTLSNITHIEKAAINQELFDKVYGEGKVNSEEEWNEKIKDDMTKEYEKYTLSRLNRDVQDFLIQETKMDLPADFIRKLVNANKEKDQPEIDDAQLTQFVNQTRWDLIHDKLLRDNNVDVTSEDLLEKAKTDVANYYGGAALFESNPDSLTRMAESLIADEKYANRMRDQILNDKIFEMLKTKISFSNKEVDEHEFFHH